MLTRRNFLAGASALVIVAPACAATYPDDRSTFSWATRRVAASTWSLAS